MTKRLTQRLRAAEDGGSRSGRGQELTPKQREFVRHFLRLGGDATQAAREAGYSEVSASTLGYQLLQKPHVAAAILHAQRSEFAELATIATQQARLMLLDPGLPAGARVDLIKATWDRAGLVARKDTPEDSDGSDDMREWSLDKLQAFLAEFQRQRAAAPDRAGTIIDVEDEPPVSGEQGALPAPVDV